MQSRTKTEPMPFLQQEGAGRKLMTEMQRRHAIDFSDDEPTVPHVGLPARPPAEEAGNAEEAQ